MSPNLSSAAHNHNKLMYEKVNVRLNIKLSRFYYFISLVQPRTQGTFGNESTLVDRGHVVLLVALLPRFWAMK